MKREIIFVHKSESIFYPESPFSPDCCYSELSYLPYDFKVESKNKVYAQVREVLAGMGLDQENFGSENWNPLKEIVKKGDSVVIKPNLVREKHPLGLNPLSMITHASIIRPIIDYVLIATKGDCKITICDVPLQQTAWTELLKVSGLKDLQRYYKSKGISIDILDLRKEISIENSNGVIVRRIIKERDPLGYVAVDLKAKSMLMPIIKHYKRFEITDYGKGTVPKHHNPQKNEYLIAKSFLNADVFINVPKLKTHRKAGITCAMKNLIGINGDKGWIAHHRRGSKGSGGDEYRKINSLKQAVLLFEWHAFSMIKRHKPLLPLASVLKFIFYKVLSPKKILFPAKSANKVDVSDKNTADADKYAISEGNWYGNDTIWRVIIDLNNILIYCDKTGILRKTPQRKYLCIVDSIVAGEKEGPMETTPKRCGIVVGGLNPVAVDYACTELMGFDWKKVPQVKNAFNKKYFWFAPAIHNINIKYNKKKSIQYNFTPPSGWVGHVEKNIFKSK